MSDTEEPDPRLLLPARPELRPEFGPVPPTEPLPFMLNRLAWPLPPAWPPADPGALPPERLLLPGDAPMLLSDEEMDELDASPM